METKVSHARFFALLKQMPNADKESIVMAYSNGETTSLSEFYANNPRGYNFMIADLQKKQNAETLMQTKKLRSAILKRLQKYGIDTTDWHEVNRFMRQPRIAGKTLGEMSIDEMQTLIPKLQSILKKDADKRERIETIIQLN